ncbi:MAG: cytochrome c-type biogenesis CcmF C-terminal domain-containing protein [Acidimicrobiia bacterium]
MIAAAGALAVWAAVIGAFWLAVVGFGTLRGGDRPTRVPVALLLWGSVAAMGLLVAGLLLDDFSITYVANHSAATTPLIFTLASAWGALEGSIVLWGLMLGAFTWLIARGVGDGDRLGRVALAVMAVVSFFFFALMATVANPFEVCVEAAEVGCAESSAWPLAATEAPSEGRGPNPLLQNHILMAVHPPALYVGYVGLTAPFAFAMAALALGLPGADWARRTQRWTLGAWAFLTIGILLGGWWSYEVLGWGGYWAWDPVENASILPWLTATAFLHSVVVQLRRGMLQAWNFVLVIATFALTIFGTFLTRSGTITSVHSFTQSAIGPILLGFFVLVTVVGLGLFAARADLVSDAPKLESLASREGAILGNSLVMTVWAATILVGTVYPILVEAFSDTTIGIGRGFFDVTSIPIAFAMLLMMGVGQVTPWKSASRTVLVDRLLIPAQVALTVGAVAVIAGLRARGPLLAIVLAVFVATPPLVLLVRQARARPEGFGGAVRRLVTNDRGYWGGMLSHLGVAVIVIGIAGSSGLALRVDETTIPVTETVTVAGYDLTYETGFTSNEPQRRVIGASVLIERDGRSIGEVRPRLNDYGVQVVPTPGVDAGVTRDLYITLRAIDGERIIVDVSVFPLQWMVWAGGLLIAAGGFWALSGSRGRARRSAEVAS